jgi:hypothetical protein
VGEDPGKVVVFSGRQLDFSPAQGIPE